MSMSESLLEEIMNIYAIGDLHLSGNPPTKPMDIFGPHWDNHWARIKEHWQQTVSDEDIVFLVGDMSWALRLDEALVDLEEIASMPGQKYMIRGNHDYWWSSANKMKQAMGESIHFMQGHGTAQLLNISTNTPSHLSVTDGSPTHGDSATCTNIEQPHIVAFGGTRGYMCPGDSNFKVDTDQSIYDRELMRTEAALKEMEAAIKELRVNQSNTDTLPSILSVGNTVSGEAVPITRILLLHYPPFNEHNAPSGFTDLMERYNVDICIFGHLHDQISFKRIPATFGNTELKLVSADYADFKIQHIL